MPPAAVDTQAMPSSRHPKSLHFPTGSSPESGGALTKHLKWDQGVQTHDSRWWHTRPKNHLVRVLEGSLGGCAQRAWGKATAEMGHGLRVCAGN